MSHPPPLHLITITFIFFVFISSPLFVDSATAHTCPPFIYPLSFPFGSSPGHGHPSFQIHCSSPYSTISINNLTFSIIRHEPNSTTLFLSPKPNPSPSNHNSCTNLSSFSLPTHSLDLSNSPFRFSDNYCSRLSVVKPCLPINNQPNCSLCIWECDLLRHPIRLLHGCEPNNHPISDQGCQADVFEHLRQLLDYGIPVNWDENHDTYFSNCTACQTKNGVCGFNSSNSKKPFLCLNLPSHQTRKIPKLVVILCSFFIFTCLLLIIAVVIAITRCRGRKSTVNEEEEDPTMLILHRHRSPNLLPPVFSYIELESSTNRFDPRRKIGDGGFGTVYLGQLYDGRIVAVKKLHRPLPSTLTSSTKSFCNEILILSSIEHPNLVKLHGYCSDPKGLLLVYDYVPNGTLADHLHGCKSSYRKGSLTWQLRVDVALQTAMALEYLHFSVEPAIVHRDITSSNIFIEKDMRIKVGDFGLSRLLIFPEQSSSSSSDSSGYVCTGPQGTPGYLDPEYHRSFRLTEKSDVYSFGVVLFELISGMKAVDLSREKRDVALADLVVSKIQMGLLHQVVDPVLISEGLAMGTVDAVAELAFRCVAADKDDRPNAKEVVSELRRIRSRTRGT